MSKYIQSTLAQLPDYFNETLELIEKEFKYPSHHKFLTDFYPLMGPLNHHNCHILLDGNKVIGHIALKERTLSYKDNKTKVALIGAIALDEKYQQQGNFTPFFKNIIKKYSKNNSLLLLWSDLKPLYNRFNFYEAGGVIQTGKKMLLDESLPDNWKKKDIKSLSDNELSEIKKLYNNQDYLTLSRNDNDWDLIKEITSSSLYIKEVNGTIQSYFIKDKGNDLGGIIHEFSCKNNDVISEIEELIDFQLWLPEKYNSTFNKKDIFYSSFIHISNKDLFSKFLQEITNGSLTIDKLDGEKISITFNNASFDFNTEEFLTGLFGPNPIEEFSQLIPSIFIAGVDSI